MSEHGPIGYFVHHQGRGHAERAAAIANAIYNATGVRVREYPMTLDRLIDQLPEATPVV